MGGTTRLVARPFPLSGGPIGPASLPLEAMPEEPKQKTRPRKGEAVERPVPKRRDVVGVLKRAALRRTSTSR
jgi:hypothetical protein